MTRPSPSHVAVAAGLAVSSVAAGLLLATTASAADLAAPTVPATVTAGTVFTVTGTGCPTVDPGRPSFAVVLTDAATTVDDVVVSDSRADGSWSAVLSFPAGTPAGEHEIGAVCRTDRAGEATEVEYPIVAVALTARPTGPAGAPRA